MNQLFNTSQKFIYIKDMTDQVNFDLVNEEFDKLTFKNNVSNKISDEMNLFDKPYFEGSKQNIIKECTTYLDNTLNIKGMYEGLKMTNSWANISEPGTGHHEHMHPFSIVSGVMFLDDNEHNLNLYVQGYTSDIPYFLSMNKTYVSLKHLFIDLGIDPKQHNNLKNHMVLFLSNCYHFVEETPLDSKPRRSLSFNTFWTGLTGVGSESLGSYKF